MQESQLLSRIYARSGDLGPWVVLGPGDDCAVVRTRLPGAADSGSLLLTVDHVVEGRHVPIGAPAEMIGRKAVARSVSDIAAMGGRPIWALATAALSAGTPQSRADELFDAMSRWARHWNCPLVGGDISGVEGPSVFTLTVGGVPHESRGPVTRSGARVGDQVYVTGGVGGAVSSGRHATFEPRLADARFLADAIGERLHAMIDISDGLGRDAGRVAAASGVRLEIDAARVPLSEGVRDWRAAAGEGEDYELLVCVAGDAAVPERSPMGTALTRIGRVTAGAGCVFIDAGGSVIDGAAMGWDHQ